MSEAITVALIAGVCSIFGQWLITRKNKKDSDVKRAVREQKIDDRLNVIEAKLDTHNGYAEKFGEIQQDIAVIKTEIKNLKEA